MKTVGSEKVLESGDKICCQGKTYTIDKIVSCDYYGEQDEEVYVAGDSSVNSMQKKIIFIIIGNRKTTVAM